MIRALMYLLLVVFLTLNLGGCSLFGSDEEEQETATVSEEKKEGDEYSYDDFEEGDDSGESAKDDDFDDEAGEMDEEVVEVGAAEEASSPVDIETEDAFADTEAVDDYPDDDYSLEGNDSGGSGDVAALEPTPDKDDFGDELAMDEGGGDQDIPEEPLESNEEEDLFARDEEPEPAPAPVPEETYADTGSFGGGDYSDVPAFIPVKKMKPAAYKRAGANINRLYVVRSGEDMSAIANKIYGQDRSEDLYKWNSHFQGKGLKVGDKIYYSSPNNPNDQSMKTYYEDNGISPQYYTAQKDQNFRTVSKKLLGHERSWMEVYATNDSVDDKWSLPTGTQLRYWPEGAAATVAQAKPPAPTPAPEPEPEPEEEPEVEEVAEVEEVEEIEEDIPEVEEVADVEEPEPPGDKDFDPPPAAGSMQPTPPPPPNPVAPPPPPPPPSPLANKLNNVKKAAGGSSLGAQDDSMIMGALGGLLILAAVILLVFLRRGRSKRVNFSQTQV